MNLCELCVLCGEEKASTQKRETTDFLKFKYLAKQPPEVAALGGLWQDLDFDVTDEDVRALRQRVTSELLNKV
ncbi:MAG: hypothetical protein H5T62_05660 [Anaerolineae bacterium]|nr:hypothetical protein [Anaerolineae bacterium]